MSTIMSDGGGRKGGALPVVLAVVAVLVLAIGAYFGSAYLAVNGLAQAARAGDTDKLNRMVDFASVRDGLKTEFTAALTKRFSNDPNIAQSPFGGLAASLAPAIVGKLVDSLVTPAGVAAMIETGRAEPQAENGVPKVDTGPKPKFETALNFVDTNRVQVATEVDGKPGAVLGFNRDGLFGWKLVRIGLPPSALAELDGSAAPAAAPLEAPVEEVAAEPAPTLEPTPALEPVPPDALAAPPAAPPIAGAPRAASPPQQVAAARPAPRADPPRSPQEILASDAALQARERRVRDMLINARDRDVTGQVMDEELDARNAWSRCRTRACLQAWYSQRERALGVWEGN